MSATPACAGGPDCRRREAKAVTGRRGRGYGRAHLRPVRLADYAAGRMAAALTGSSTALSYFSKLLAKRRATSRAAAS